jgi:YD repeat-containing protein
MKKIINSLLLIASVSSLMTACKKENLTSNENQPEAAPSAISNGRGGGVIANQKTYTLTRRGNDSLVYLRDGRLGKVINSATKYVQYSYGGNTINTKTFENNVLQEETTYQLDSNTGRTIESTKKAYSYYSLGTVVTTTIHKYTYDGSGRLTSKYNKNKPNERYDYYQGSDSYMIEVYSSNNSRVYTHDYTIVNKVLNKLKLNPEKSGLDIYLKIFGTVSKYINTSQATLQESTHTWIFAENLEYTYNADGYPTQFIRKDLVNGAPPKTEIFNYIVTN